MLNWNSSLIFSIGAISNLVCALPQSFHIQTDMESEILPPSNLVILPPILHLPVELHREIASHLEGDEDFALLNLRMTNLYFHNTIHPPTHETLLRLEKRFSGTLGYACKHCLRLRPASKFATTVLKGKTGLNGGHRSERFCADCGFDVTKPERYTPGAKVIVDGMTYVYCVDCRKVKKGEEAGIGQCRMSCELCYKRFGCKCRYKCVAEKGKKPAALRDYVIPSRIAGVQVPRRRESLYAVASDTESDDEYEYEADDTYDAYYYAGLDDDDWRAFS
ncbi:hypothetical protein GQ44DRAFT_124759 [Phaeosphaeriaceae sp. PMI808]|nr:hypothetical protein GQ44DRAFT_124759 [Phaeosphaeriaceae sp. PMI808]